MLFVNVTPADLYAGNSETLYGAGLFWNLEWNRKRSRFRLEGDWPIP